MKGKLWFAKTGCGQPQAYANSLRRAATVEERCSERRYATPRSFLLLTGLERVAYIHLDATRRIRAGRQTEVCRTSYFNRMPRLYPGTGPAGNI